MGRTKKITTPKTCSITKTRKSNNKGIYKLYYNKYFIEFEVQ